ncbi:MULTISPECIES: hypothetical protein [unclassified Gilliamella]|uniref:hypothetical protein n=1 Tax=unclassified Gilliamella TaxID=2685620 RepID=UPI00132A3AB9|nr:MULTISPECIES: hypothetical protein [unclassified Gilliamella]MWN32929.1 hypothetical protein [Gilliamella sp. Pra-s60]MWP30377.1 hypothetical protein [Gilliamella sp. Pra-s54]
MNVEIDFEELKRTILLAAKKQELSENYVNENWMIAYDFDENKRYTIIFNNLKEEIKLLNQAIVANDLLTSMSAIIMATAFSQILADFFDKINDDIFQLGWGDELKDKWPKIPEDYKVPAHYDYEERYKPYSQQIADKSSS